MWGIANAEPLLKPNSLVRDIVWQVIWISLFLSLFWLFDFTPRELGLKRPTRVPHWWTLPAVILLQWVIFFGGLRVGIFTTAGLAYHSSVAAILGWILFPAFGEELVFRGWLQPRIQDVLNSETQAIFLTTTYFAALHLIRPWGIEPSWSVLTRFLAAFLCGIIAGKAQAAYGSVYPAMLLHATFNSSDLLYRIVFVNNPK